MTVTLFVATGILRATDKVYQTISKFHHKQQSYGLETNFLQVTLTVATRILRTSCYDDQLYQTIFKFHHKQQSYVPDTNLLQGCPATLMVVTGILRATTICSSSIISLGYNN